MNEEKSCCSCRFYDGICCMYECKCLAILDEEDSANECGHYDFGKYDQLELEKTNYR